MLTRQPYMTATFGDAVENAANLGPGKELIARYKLVDKKSELVVVDCRLYMGRSSSASSLHCALWVHGKESRSGRGTASGYGYHKSGAAVSSAISSAGITLWGSPYGHPVNGDTPQQTRKLLKTRAHIGGCGDSSIECALMAIAYTAGFRNCIMVRG